MIRVKAAVQRLVLELSGDVNEKILLLGFKEIRILTEKDFGILLEYFPCARFIFNVRTNVTTQAKSWSQFLQSEASVNKIEEVNVLLRELYRKNENRGFWLPLKSFSAPTFNRLLNWLGIANCQYVRVAHENRGGFTFNCNSSFLDETVHLDSKISLV
jgi:hypothetical protein